MLSILLCNYNSHRVKGWICIKNVCKRAYYFSFENLSQEQLHFLISKNLFHCFRYIGSLSLYPPPTAKKGGHSETLLNACIAHSNSAHLLLSNNASDWLSDDFDKKNQ